MTKEKVVTPYQPCINCGQGEPDNFDTEKAQTSGIQVIRDAEGRYGLRCVTCKMFYGVVLKELGHDRTFRLLCVYADEAALKLAWNTRKTSRVGVTPTASKMSESAFTSVRGRVLDKVPHENATTVASAKVGR